VAVIVVNICFGEDGKNFRSIVSDRVLIVCRNLIHKKFLGRCDAMVALDTMAAHSLVSGDCSVFGGVQSRECKPRQVADSCP